MSIEARLERFFDVAHQGVIPNHHFAAASSECIDLYRDGYLLSAAIAIVSEADLREAGASFDVLPHGPTTVTKSLQSRQQRQAMKHKKRKIA